MNSHNLVIYELDELYKIFEEIKKDINFDFEKINIELIKKNFQKQSEILIGNYIFNINSREMSSNANKLKLTEKEISSIIYLLKAKKPVKIRELQSNVWGYQSQLETHTVETHIYRLRKKISKVFKDKSFILSKDDGYEISKKE